MKIAVIGYSGSGKSTLARKLAEQHCLEVLHLDSVFWLPGWIRRSREEMREIVSRFLDSHDGWVIDGNYSRICFERKIEEADRILLLQFSALNCLWRVWKRYHKYKGCTRADMGEGCPERFDLEFLLWVWNYNKRNRQRNYQLLEQTTHAQKIVLKNRRAVKKFLKWVEEEHG